MTITDTRDQTKPPRNAESERCWAITSYFNPVGFRTRLANYRTFRENLQSPLLTIEWSIDGRFDLSESDADVLVQLSSPDLMWQKERLLNIGLHALPDHVEYVAWLDADVIFDRADWPAAVARELETSAVVQLFSRCAFVGPDSGAGALRVADGVESAASLVHLSLQPGAEADRFARLWESSPWKTPRRDRLAGLAWAARRDFLEHHGFYDACVFGAGDRALACAAFGVHRRAHQAWLRTPHQRRHYFAWADPFAADVAGRIGLIEGDLIHLWHGKIENRQYRLRHLPAEQHGSDPGTDIEIDPATGLWRWASPKEALHRALAEFFDRRREDIAAE